VNVLEGGFLGRNEVFQLLQALLEELLGELTVHRILTRHMSKKR
jgi:hypothetical protein